MSAVQHSDEHRVTALVRGFREELSQVSGVPLWSMPAAEAGDVLVLLTQVRSQLDALQMRVLRHASGLEVGSDSGATTANWWANETRTTHAEARRVARLATALERQEEVAAALARGELRTDQARVVVEAVDALPADVADWVLVEATRFLVKHAADHDARGLRVLGRRVLEVIDPVAADREEARRLEAEEADARARASFTMVDDGHGQSHGRFSIPTLHADMLRKHLLAIAFPGTFSRNETSPDAAAAARRLTKHRMGQAFVDYIESRPASSAASRPPRSTPGHGSAPAKRAGSRVVPGSSRSFSADRRSCLTPVAGVVSTPRPSASRWAYATAAAPRPVATRHPRSAMPTTRHRGRVAAAPASRRADSSARSTTASSTTMRSSTSSTSTGRSGSPGERESHPNRTPRRGYGSA